jgi:UDP:flavonoid glycosyltransferase YjiC (YdhE family)
VGRIRITKLLCEWIRQLRPPFRSYLTCCFYSAGIPQIILAQWYDLYDMAARAEYRGIGIYGNKKVAPDIEAVEFGAAVARLVRPGKESEGFRMRAKVVGEVCRESGGKRAAVDKILEMIEGKE